MFDTRARWSAVTEENQFQTSHCKLHKALQSSNQNRKARPSNADNCADLDEHAVSKQTQLQPRHPGRFLRPSVVSPTLGKRDQ